MVSAAANPAEALGMLFDSGIDAVSTGERALARPSSRQLFHGTPNLLRPLNLPPGTPGCGARLCGREGRRFWLISLSCSSDRKPLDDPFESLTDWFRQNEPGTPVFITFSGMDLPLKKALFWKLADSSTPIHWIGSGLGLFSPEVYSRHGNIFISDTGTTESLGGIGGWAPETWWKHNQEHLPQTGIPPGNPLKMDGVRIHLDDAFRAVRVEPFTIVTRRGNSPMENPPFRILELS